jgi:catechol 2,3-dioxygenase-like lactoylglutathione lyase family enzyme
MNPFISFVTLGVADLDRAKQFYGEGLGWPIAVAQGQYVAFRPSEGSSTLTLYPRATLAADAGVDPVGNGFRGVTFSYVVRSNDRVDAALADAERAGGSIVKPAQDARWGGYFGYFADPDGNLWKVVAGTGEQPYAE